MVDLQQFYVFMLQFFKDQIILQFCSNGSFHSMMVAIPSEEKLIIFSAISMLILENDWFVWFGGISTIVGYLMPNPLYTYISNIYDLVWLGFMAYQPL